MYPIHPPIVPTVGFTQTNQSVDESDGNVTVCIRSSGFAEILSALISVTTVAGTASGELASYVIIIVNA